MLGLRSWDDEVDWGTCLTGDGFEVGLDVGDLEDGDEELGVGVACEGDR